MATARQTLLKDLTAIGTDLKKNLWTERDRQHLALIARDIAGLAGKMLDTKSAAKKRRYKREIELLTVHVAVRAYSRLNVVEQNARDMILRLLEKTAQLTVSAFLAQMGIK